jgi:hypothetical protein
MGTDGGETESAPCVNFDMLSNCSVYQIWIRGPGESKAEEHGGKNVGVCVLSLLV